MLQLKVILVFFCSILHSVQATPNDHTQRVLEAWIETQNNGTDEAINQFIDEFYHPNLLKKMKNRDKHVAFYRQIIDEFGDIQSAIYETEADEPYKLKVQLLKEGSSSQTRRHFSRGN